MKPHIQWCSMDFMPSTNRIDTIHMVPVMSKVATEPDMARASQCMELPPRKYALISREARFWYQNPRPITIAKYPPIMA
jgi:hypothetical protein